MNWYLFGIAAAVVMGAGLWYTNVGIRKQRDNGTEFDPDEPPRNAVVRPFTRNPIVVMYIVVPIITLILGIIVWLITG